MARLDYSNGRKKGRLLSTGHGMNDMMTVCYQNKWDDDNTILVVADGDNLDSKWYIYAIQGE